jgi:hypothetical protein
MAIRLRGERAGPEEWATLADTAAMRQICRHRLITVQPSRGRQDRTGDKPYEASVSAFKCCSTSFSNSVSWYGLPTYSLTPSSMA